MTESDHSGPPLPEPSPGVDPGVRAARVRAGLTQQEVADRLRVPIDTFRRWDRGTSQPRSPQRQRQLAAVLGVSLETLFPTDDDPHVAVAMRMLEKASPASEAAGGAEGQSARSAEAIDEADESPIDERPRGLEDRETAVGWNVPGPPDSATPSSRDPSSDADPTADVSVDDPTRTRPSVAVWSRDGVVPPSDATKSFPDGGTYSAPVGGVRVRDDAARGGRRPSRLRRHGTPTAARLRAAPAAVIVLAVGVAAVVSGTADDSVPREPADAPRAAPVGPREALARRIDVAEGRRDFDLVMSLAFASGDRESYNGARTAAADLVLDRASEAVKAGRVRTAARLVARVERRYGDPRPARRASLTDRIATAREAAREAERRREIAAEQRRRAGTTAPQARPATAAPDASSSSSTQGTASSAATSTQPQASPSGGSGAASSTSRSRSDADRSPEFF